MIENMRKYTGLMAVVFVLLAAGFLFTMNDLSTGSGAGMGSGPTVLEVQNRSIDEQQYRRMGDATLQLASEAGLHTYVNFLMVPDAAQLAQAMQLLQMGYPNYYVTMNRNLTNQDFNRFVANRIILQKAIDEMGIYASDEEVTETIKTSSRFAPGGTFNHAEYAGFIDKRLGRLGMTEKNLRDIVREHLCLNKLIQVIGSGLAVPRTAAQEQLEAQLQSVTLTRVVLSRDDFVEREDPTEEAIKAYWETHKDAYKTDETRRIHYVLLTPDAQPEIPDFKPSAPPEGATEEQKKAHAADQKNKREATAIAQANRQDAINQAERVIRKEIDQVVQEIYNDEEDNKPLDFAGILAKRNHKIVKTELFSRSTLPAELQLDLRGNVNRGKSLADAIFSHMPSSSNSYDMVSDALPVGENSWIIFTLEEVVEPTLLDYATARNKARAQLISETASLKVKESAKEIRDAVVESMKAGNSFEKAVREKGLEPIKLSPFSMTGIPPKGEPAFRRLHREASSLNPGEVSKTIDENDRSLFFLLVKREIEDTEQSKARVDYMVNNSKGELMLATFLNWLNDRYDKANVQGLATQDR